jgi:uncharacterized membrane-anchored protein
MSLFLLCQSSLLHAGEISRTPQIADADMLCPFTIEVYPKEFQVGDIVYARMNFENSTDHPVWAPALPLNGYMLDRGILSYYFGDKSGNEYVWKQYDKKGEFLWDGTWEKILPGEKGLSQYEMIEYHRTRILECWDEIKTNRTRGHLMVRLKYYWPPKPQVDVAFPSLDIKPRPQKEMELIENFMSSEKYLAMGRVIMTMSGYSASTAGVSPNTCKSKTSAAVSRIMIVFMAFAESERMNG